MKHLIYYCIMGCSLSLVASGAPDSGDSTEEISKKLANPVANLISVPFQFNYDHGAGPGGNGENVYMKLQPVIPFDFNDNWKVISRSILPFEYERNMGFDNKAGIGDLTQTFFFTPAKLSGELIWGLGPAFLIPTASEHQFGTGKWGVGPSPVLVWETKQWTVGVLANHIWSFAGKSDRNYVSESFVQPFITYHLPQAWSITFTSEYTYDWHENQETIPLNLSVAKVVKIGKMPVSFSLGGRYYADKPSEGPKWGLRAMVTLVF